MNKKVESVLILEDSQERLDWFFEKLKDFEIMTTPNPQEAIDWLESTEFDYIFLDHDLLPEHYDEDTSCNKTTGLCVAEWLGTNTDKSKDAFIIVHSMNWNGVSRMRNAMKLRSNMQCIMYDELQKKLIIN